MRGRNLNILSIDGVEGSGKTTQINVIANHFKSLDIPIKVTQIDGTDQSIGQSISSTEIFLDKNPKGIVLNDGTVTKSIVEHIFNGYPHQKIEDLYRDYLFRLQVLEHKYGTLNILLNINDLDICNNRLKRRQELMRKEVVGIGDIDLQKNLSEGFRYFDNSILSRNLKFHLIDVDERDSIMDIDKRIKNLITDNGFDIKKAPIKGL